MKKPEKKALSEFNHCCEADTCVECIKDGYNQACDAFEAWVIEGNLHCKDCCCTQAWKALGIKEYTGKSIPEHIEELRKQVTQLPSKKEISDIAYKYNFSFGMGRDACDLIAKAISERLGREK